jgi:serine/threonine protein kinase
MKIRLEDEYVLPEDVKLTPISELSEGQRAAIQAKEGQVAITRRNARVSAKVLDPEMAELIHLFRTPRTIADAIEGFARSANDRWEEVVDTVYPRLRALIQQRYLVPASSQDEEKVEFEFEIGAEFQSHTITRRIRLLEDTEIYMIRSSSGTERIAKLLGRRAQVQKRTHFSREATILRRLPEHLGPELIEEGLWQDRPYLIMEWIPGLSATERASHLRRRGRFGYDELLKFCLSILKAYERLHESAVIHADVHPNNVLCSLGGGVRLIDFGLAHVLEPSGFPVPERSGVAYYMEPEWAAARISAAPTPAPTVLGEQYAIGALLYEILNGSHAIPFVVVKDEMLRQICEDQISPMSAPVLEICPEIEQVVRRCLEKDPTARYPSMRHASMEFSAAIDRGAAGAPILGSHRKSQKLIDRMIRLTTEDLKLDTIRNRPMCSVMNGAAGIALGLHRIASARDEASLFALADLWANRAAADSGLPLAFRLEGQEEIEVIGRTTPFHTIAGVWFTLALLAADRGDAPSFILNATSFVKEVRHPTDKMDLTLGQSGALLAAAMLVERAPPEAHIAVAELTKLSNQLSLEIGAWLDGLGPVGTERAFHHTGIAHGWPGVLYALLGWARVASLAPPASVRMRLDEFAACGEPTGMGLRWPSSLLPQRARSYFPSWCNGNGGLVPFWVLAAEVLQDDVYMELARRTAENTWEEPSGVHSICCGKAGQAYGLLSLYQAGGQKIWLERAQQLAQLARDRIPDSEWNSTSLYRGALGVAVLLADLERPAFAEMPGFALLARPAVD